MSDLAKEECIDMVMQTDIPSGAPRRPSSEITRTEVQPDDGRRQIAAFYLPGDLLGLEPGEEHVFSAEAVSDVRLLVINRSTMVSRAKSNNDIARQLWTLMSRELQIAQ